MEKNTVCTRARDYVEENMKAESMIVASGGFKLPDLHSKHQLLNFSDGKVGKLSGGTDLAITPFKTAKSAFPFQSCCLFELKAQGEDRDGYENQAIFEFVAARCLSHQPNILIALTLISPQSNCVAKQLRCRQ